MIRGNFFNILMVFSFLWLFALVGDAADISLTHSLTESDIWTSGSGHAPDSSLVTLSVTNTQEVPPRPPVDIVLALDCTGSMSKTDPNRIRVEAAKILVNMTDLSRDRIGVVLWNDTVINIQQLTSNNDNIFRAIESTSAEIPR